MSGFAAVPWLSYVPTQGDPSESAPWVRAVQCSAVLGPGFRSVPCGALANDCTRTLSVTVNTRVPVIHNAHGEFAAHISGDGVPGLQSARFVCRAVQQHPSFR